MSRHRNVRSMNYSEECEGFDDVYGHSVEDDYCVSPSVAEQFIYDRSRRPQMSAFLSQEEEIAEEDEEEEEGGEEHQHGIPKCAVMSGTKGLSDMDQARLQSCLEEVRNVIGDSIAEQTVIEAVLHSDFNVERALNMVLNNATEVDQSGALKTEKTDQRKEKDVCSNCYSYFSPRGSNNTCAISGSKGSLTVPLTGGGGCGSGICCAQGGSNSSAQDVEMGAKDQHFTLHTSEQHSGLPSLPPKSEVKDGGGDHGCGKGTIISTDLGGNLLEQAPTLHPPSDSEDEEDNFPSLCSLVIHNTGAHGVVPHEEGKVGKPPATFEWSPCTGMGLQVGAGDDSEDSMDELPPLCSLVVHSRSERGPSLPKNLPPFSVPALITPKKTRTEQKMTVPQRGHSPSDPSSEDEEDNFSSLHSLVIRNRSAPLEDEVSGVPCGQVPSLRTPNKPIISSSSPVDYGCVSEAMEIKDTDSEEEDDYSSLCSLVIHNRSTHSEGPRDPKGSLVPPFPAQRKTTLVVPPNDSGGHGSLQEEVDRAYGGSFVIPPLLVMPKPQGCARSMEAHVEMGSEGSEEEEDYVIDLCGTLKSMDVESISSAEDCDSQDVLASVKYPSEVEDKGNKEIKWKIIEEGWVQEPVEGMRLIDVNSRKLSPFGRVLCKNWECLKQLERPRKKDAVTSIGALAFLFDQESPDDVCRRLRSQKYLVQVNTAKVTS